MGLSSLLGFACNLPANFLLLLLQLCHIINPLLTKLVRAKMAGNWPRSFLRVHEWRRKHAKKNLANILPSYPHAWSITHMHTREKGIKRFNCLA